MWLLPVRMRGSKGCLSRRSDERTKENENLESLAAAPARRTDILPHFYPLQTSEFLLDLLLEHAYESPSAPGNDGHSSLSLRRMSGNAASTLDTNIIVAASPNHCIIAM